MIRAMGAIGRMGGMDCRAASEFVGLFIAGMADGDFWGTGGSGLLWTI